MNLYRCGNCNKISSEEEWIKRTKDVGFDIRWNKDNRIKYDNFFCPKCGQSEILHKESSKVSV